MGDPRKLVRGFTDAESLPSIRCCAADSCPATAQVAR